MKVEPGGLNNINDVKLLICRVLCELDNPISMVDLTEGILADGYVNYFDFAVALSELCDSGHIRREKVDEASVYYVTGEGRDADSLLGGSLPLAVCEKVCAGVLASKSGGRAECRVEPHELGCTVSMLFKYEGRELFNVKIEAGDENTAEDIKRHFLENPHDVYLSLIKLIR